MSQIEETNYCTECGINMGPGNPRQLCGKTICWGMNSYEKQEEDVIEIKKCKKKRKKDEVIEILSEISQLENEFDHMRQKIIKLRERLEECIINSSSE